MNKPESATGWYSISNAFSAHLDGDAKLARNRLRLLTEELPGSKAAEEATRLLTKMDDEGYGVEDPYGSRKASGLARAELAIYQTLAGIAAGGFMCGAAGCGDSRAVIALLAGGGTVGLAGSLLLTSKGISPGRALAVNSGTSWGIWHGVAIGLAHDGIRNDGTWSTLVVGQLAGTAVGAAAAYFFDPRAGDVSMPTSAGLWTGGIMALSLGLFGGDFDQTGFFTAVLVASDVGLAAGALAAYKGWYPMSRARSLLIDTGGVVGLLVGIGLPILVQGDNVDEDPVFAGGLLGTLGGLAAATYLTRHWDIEAPEVSLSVAPVQGGGATVGVGGRF